MKKILILLTVLFSFLLGFAGDGDSHLSINVGIQAPYTLDATIGYEFPYGNGHAFEIFGEAGNHWRTPICCQFWKGYFWDGGATYKHRIVRFKNGNMRLVGGAMAGMFQQDFFCGIELGVEYNYVFANSWELTFRQRNNVNFFHGDVFRCGVMLGVKIPF